MRVHRNEKVCRNRFFSISFVQLDLEELPSWMGSVADNSSIELESIPFIALVYYGGHILNFDISAKILGIFAKKLIPAGC